MKLTVIGIDGASFELIGPWLENGELPSIKKLKSNGAFADMESELPPVTSPNWKCYSTGKNPGKLGIFWWVNADVEAQQLYFPQERKYKNLEIWDYLSIFGYKVGVIGTPLTYPPKKVNGVMISGGPDSENRGFTFPQELEDIIKEKFNFRPRPIVTPDVDPEGAYLEILELIKSQFEVTLWLIKRYKFDFLQHTIFDINVLQHHFWDGDETLEAWKIIDRYIGKIVKYTDNILLMSDHGSNKIETVFNINEFLLQRGYLKLRTNRISSITSHISVEQVLKILNKLKLSKVIEILPKSIIKKVSSYLSTIEGIPVSELDKFIDWERTKAFALSQGPIYINRKKMDSNEYKDTLKSLLEELSSMRNPEGLPIIKKRT